MMEINIGNLEFYNEIEIGNLQLDVKNVYPELEKVTVQSRSEEQVVKPKTKYGFSEVTVKPMEILLQNKKITDDGTYSADEGYDGLKEVVVNTADTMINKFFHKKINDNNTGLLKYIKRTPPLDFSEATSTRSLFENCSNLTEVGELNTANITDMYQMFRSCSKLEKLLDLDCTSCIDAYGLCYANTKLEEFSIINATKIENMSNMFWNCAKLKHVEGLDNLKPLKIAGAFGNCGSLERVPNLDTSEVERFNSTFQGIPVKDIPMLEAGKATSISNVIYVSTNITNFGGMHELGKAYASTQTANFADYTLNAVYSPKLTHESLMNIINNLYDIKSIGVKTQQLVLGAKNVAKLTAEEIKIATDKGWSVS